MAGKSTLSVGDFSGGMITDVIGAQNSMLDIRDGWIPRAGEIRKRGGKSRYGLLDGTFQNSYRAGAKSTELGSGSLQQLGSYNDPSAGYGVAFVGNGSWAVKRASDIGWTPLDRSETIDWNETTIPPTNDYRDVPYGGGDQIKNYGSILVSTGYAPSEGDPRMVGKWGGALVDINVTATSVVLTNGSTDAVSTVGGFIPSNWAPGLFVTIGEGNLLAPPPNPNQGITFMVISATVDRIVLDRPWPGPNGTTYTINPRFAIAKLDDPINVGANAAKCLEAHQDRLFGANYDPSFSTEGGLFGIGSPITASEKQRNQSRVGWSAIWSENGQDYIDQSGTPVIADASTNLLCYGENLWYPNAFFDVFPGQGGAITGLHSLGNELVVVKEDGVYSLRGTFTSLASTPGSVQADVIQHESGSPSYRGSVRSDLGVVWANNRGLWVYDGSQVTNLVDGRLSVEWRSFINDYTDCVVSSINNRIVVQAPGTDNAWVYHVDKQYFVRQTANPHSQIVAFGDRYFGDIELAVDDDTGNVVDWSGDLTEERATDSENAAYPSLRLITQALPGGEHPFFSGRPNLVLVAGNFTENMSASIVYGRRSVTDSYFETDDQVAPDDTQPLEYGIVSAQNGAIDQQDRIPIGGVASRAAHQIIFTQTVESDRLRFYGIGVEYNQDFTSGNDNEN